MNTVTFDTTTKPDDALVLAAIAANWHVAFASVSLREAKGSDFEVTLKKHDHVPEIALWNESSWNNARWADEQCSDRLEKVLSVISNGSFPKSRNSLTEGQLHQLRDAMILEAHAAKERAVFVSADAKAFIKSGRREQLESLLKTRILSPSEFEAELNANRSSGV